MKNILLLVTFLLSFNFYGQFKTIDMTLKALQSLAYNTPYESMISDFDAKNIKYELTKDKENQTKLYFKIGETSFIILYSENKKLIYAGIFPDALKVMLESGENVRDEELIKNNFKYVMNEVKREDIFKPYIVHYKKADFQYEFIIIYRPKTNSDNNPIYIFDKEFGSFEDYYQEY